MHAVDACLKKACDLAMFVDEKSVGLATVNRRVGPDCFIVFTIQPCSTTMYRRVYSPFIARLSVNVCPRSTRWGSMFNIGLFNPETWRNFNEELQRNRSVEPAHSKLLSDLVDDAEYSAPIHAFAVAMRKFYETYSARTYKND